MKASSDIALLVETIAKCLVDEPDEVVIQTTEGHTTWVVELKVADSDVGKVIGREGKTANAIRVIVNAAAGKEKVNVVLQIVDPAKRA